MSRTLQQTSAGYTTKEEAISVPDHELEDDGPFADDDECEEDAVDYSERECDVCEYFKLNQGVQ